MTCSLVQSASSTASQAWKKKRKKTKTKNRNEDETQRVFSSCRGAVALDQLGDR
jgi:hypothetical protein